MTPGEIYRVIVASQRIRALEALVKDHKDRWTPLILRGPPTPVFTNEGASPARGIMHDIDRVLRDARAGGQSVVDETLYFAYEDHKEI